jgi:short-subunit dehydrogenase
MLDATRKLAVVTGASSGIGLELAELCAKDGYDLIIAADDPKIETAASELKRDGIQVESLLVDLATLEGVDKLYGKIGGRPVAALLANAGHGLGNAFLDQNWEDIRHVVDTNITGTIYLIHKVGRDMREQGEGKILITGSIAGYIPGSYQAVYNGSKAFIDSFSYALREELRNTRISVTVLMPGPTETEFFERAELMDTKVGVQEKDDPAKVAKDGYDAMLAGEGGVVSGWQNKMQVATAGIVPPERMAKKHTELTEPGSAKKK